MDKLSIILSSIALLVSLITIYLEFFRKISRINLRLVNIGYERSDEGIIDLVFCFGNNGDVQYLVNDVSLITPLEDHEGELIHHTEVNGAPVILESNKVNIITISCNTVDFVIGNRLFVKFRISAPNGSVLEYLHEVSLDNQPENMWKAINLNNGKVCS